MTAAEIIDLIKNVGFPIAVAGFLLWRIEPLLKDLIAAVRDLSDHPEKMAEHLKPLFKEQTDAMVRDMGHDTRGALGPVMVALSRRDSESVLVLHDINAKLDRALDR